MAIARTGAEQFQVAAEKVGLDFQELSLCDMLPPEALKTAALRRVRIFRLRHA